MADEAHGGESGSVYGENGQEWQQQQQQLQEEEPVVEKNQSSLALFGGGDMLGKPAHLGLNNAPIYKPNV